MCLYLAITNPRLLGFLTSLKVPINVNNIGNFKCAVTTKHLSVIVKKRKVR